MYPRWLAPFVVAVLTLARAAHADLPPPVPWHFGQSGTFNTPTQSSRKPGTQAFTPDPTTPTVLPLRGTNIGSPFALTCAGDELAVGLWGRSATKIDALGLYCARLRPNGTLGIPERRPALGGGMTTPFELICPRHEAMLGIRGRAGTSVDRIGARCARVRRWVGEGTPGATLPSYGGTGGSPFNDECPAGYLLQGVLGFSNAAVNSLQGLCVPIVW